MKFKFFMPQIVQFDKSINLFCLIFLKRFYVCSMVLQLTQYASIFHRIFRIFFFHPLMNYLRKKKSSRLVFGSIKALEKRASIVFNLSFPDNTILSCFFLFSLIIGLYVFIPDKIAQAFIPMQNS